MGLSGTYDRVPIGRTDTITGGAGADLLTGGTGNDVFAFANAASVAAASVTGLNQSNQVQAGTTFLFSNGVDVVTDFSTTDKIDAVVAVGASSLIGVSTLTAGENASVRGTYNGTTFVVAANGADMLFGQGVTNNTALATTTNFVVLQGFGTINGADTIAASYIV